MIQSPGAGGPADFPLPHRSDAGAATRHCLTISGKRLAEAPGCGGGRCSGESGFTLVELLVSLALFGLIAVAGLALVDSTLSIQSRTEGRLEHLADIERAMFVVTSDLEQIAAGPVAGGGAELTFSRHGDALAGGAPTSVRYVAAGGVLARVVGRSPAQRVLSGATSVSWRFYASGIGWITHWPISEEDRNRRPQAISLDLTLSGDGRPGLSGRLHRVVALPVQP